MEHTLTRRRTAAPARVEYPIVYQLIILLRSRKEMKVMCTNTSVSVRATILCELALRGLIVADAEGVVRTVRNSDREIEKEFIYKIGQCRYDVRQLLRALNGEMSKELAVKNMRSKIYREMESRNILHRKKTMMYTKVVIDNFEGWSAIYGRMLSECRANALSIENKIILVCLNFIDRLECLLLQCNEADASCVLSSLSDVKAKIRDGVCRQEEKLVFSILGLLLR